MIDFIDIRSGTKSEQIRAYSVERSIELVGIGGSAEAVICVSKMLEDYITTGEMPSNAITAAVEEGYGEGRFEVKEAVESWFDNVDLDDLFKARGWVDQKGVTNAPKV